jgi:hypothetical protein
MLQRWFQAHPESVGETYLEHQQVAFGYSAALLKAGLACFLHGLMPALFQTTASRTITELHQKMAARQTQPIPVAAPSDLKQQPVR